MNLNNLDLQLDKLSPKELHDLFDQICEIDPKAGKALVVDFQKELARRKLLNFILYTMPEYQVNWHHKLICEKLDKFVSGEIKRLMVFTAPRHGKSQIVSRHLPAFILGRDPNTSIISASYGADLSCRMNRDVQRIIDTDLYREVFSETKLWGKNIRTVADGSYLRNSEMFEVVGHRGVYKSAGIGGALTGQGGAYLLCDDPIKNMEEALSKTIRDKVWDWWTSTFCSRAEKDARIALIMTRWSHDDLAGRLLKQMKDDPKSDRWEIIEIPAVLEDKINDYDPRKVGEALWPEKYPLPVLNKMKASMGTRVWTSLYQQQPTPGEGGMFKREWWKWYRVAPASLDHMALSVDCSFKDQKTSDFVVMQCWGTAGSNRYLLDQVRDRMSFTDTIKALRAFRQKWSQCREVLVEDKANGSAVIDTLKNEIPGIVPISPKESKEARAAAVSPQVEAGNVWLPDPSIATFPIGDFVEELAAFPAGTFDDCVDTMTQFLNRMSDSRFGWLYELAADKSDTLSNESMSQDLKDIFWGNRNGY